MEVAQSFLEQVIAHAFLFQSHVVAELAFHEVFMEIGFFLFSDVEVCGLKLHFAGDLAD